MKKNWITALFIAAVALMSTNTAKAEDNPDYTKSGFGIQLSGAFSVEDGCRIDGDWSRFGSDHIVTDYFAPSLTGYYKWYALNTPILKNFFVKPEAGASVQIFDGGSFNHVLFNINLTLGYTFDFKSVALDIFTGPASKIGAKKYRYTGSLDYDPTIVAHYSYNVGGVAWRFGMTLNIKRVGINISYDEPMGEMIHETLKYENESSKHGYRDGRAMSVGVSYNF